MILDVNCKLLAGSKFLLISWSPALLRKGCTDAFFQSSAKTPDSRDRLTIFVMTGSSSSRQKVRADDGRGSVAQVFVLEAVILRTLSSDNGINSETQCRNVKDL